MNFSVDDWISLAAIALPLIAKVSSDISANATTKHNLALSRITGMASRQAATIARALQAIPRASDAQTAEKTLIAASVTQMMDELGGSVAKTGGTEDKVTGIVQGELDKLMQGKNVMSVLRTAPNVIVG